MGTQVQGIINSMRRDRKGLQLDDGNWYSSYQPLPQGIDRGAQVSFSFNQKGNFKNIVGVPSVLSEQQAPAANTESSVPVTNAVANTLPPHYQITRGYATLVKEFPVPFDHPDRAIIRQNSVTNAVNLIAASGKDLSKADLSHLVEHVLDVAQHLEKYSTGDLEREALDAIDEAQAEVE